VNADTLTKYCSFLLKMSRINSADIINLNERDCYPPPKRAKRNVITVDDNDTEIRSTDHDWHDVEGNNVRKGGDTDASLARLLQERKHYISSQSNGCSEARNKEKITMMTTHTGRAWEFVRAVVDRHQKLRSSPKGRGDKISNISVVDDMLSQAERLLDCQKEFQQLNAPSKVRLAYHYTREDNMDRIKTEGLMTRADQDRTSARLNGIVYGDGVYVSTNPFAFHGRYGNVGILVAVLMGKTQRVDDRTAVRGRTCFDKQVNTIIGNKRRAIDNRPETRLFDEIVLQKSCQCLPLVRFDDLLVSATDDGGPSNDSVWAYHSEMQRLVDYYFNNGTKPSIVSTFPSKDNSSYHLSLRHAPHQGLVGGWQSDNDIADRQKMMAQLVHLLRQTKPNAPKDWLNKLPQMVKCLEEILYCTAHSFHVYNDAFTLKQRLHKLLLIEI